MMEKIVIIVFVLLVSGCSINSKPHSNRLVESVNICVLKNSRVRNWKGQIMGPELRANSVQFLNVRKLREELEAGNIDLAIGLPSSSEAQSQRLWQTKPIVEREFGFITRKSDPLKLRKYMFYGSFVRRAKFIGYVSDGEQGVVNRLVVSELPNATAFNGCGSLKSCMKALQDGSVNVLFIDKAMFKQQVEKLRSAPYTLCNLTHKQAFTVMVNQRTLLSAEYQHINAMIR